jgi:hypothetical protein
MAFAQAGEAVVIESLVSIVVWMAKVTDRPGNARFIGDRVVFRDGDAGQGAGDRKRRQQLHDGHTRLACPARLARHRCRFPHRIHQQLQEQGFGRSLSKTRACL